MKNPQEPRRGIGWWIKKIFLAVFLIVSGVVIVHGVIKEASDRWGDDETVETVVTPTPAEVQTIATPMPTLLPIPVLEND